MAAVAYLRRDRIRFLYQDTAGLPLFIFQLDLTQVVQAGGASQLRAAFAVANQRLPKIAFRLRVVALEQSNQSQVVQRGRDPVEVVQCAECLHRLLQKGFPPARSP